MIQYIKQSSTNKQIWLSICCVISFINIRFINIYSSNFLNTNLSIFSLIKYLCHMVFWLIYYKTLHNFAFYLHAYNYVCILYAYVHMHVLGK